MDGEQGAFGRLLREYRRAAGLTQVALADAAGLSERGIQNLERGVRRPYPHTLDRLVAALRLTPDQEVIFESTATRRSAVDAERDGPNAGPAGPPGERRPATALCMRLANVPLSRGRRQSGLPRTLVAGCLAAARREVERYGGVIERADEGGLTALFGVPAARQDHVAAALHATLAIRDALAAYQAPGRRGLSVPLTLKIGVESGAVALHRAGRSWRIASDSAGSPLASAVRLQRHAGPNAIWVGEATRQEAGDGFAWREIGPLPAGSGRVAELLGAGRGHACTPVGPSPLVGRGAELERLRAAWVETRAGRGQVVAIVGEAGIGKTRLLQALTREVEVGDAAWVAGSCFAHADATTYLPFRAILRSCLDLPSGSTTAAARAGIVGQLAALGLQATLASHLLHVLGYRVDDPLVRRLSPALVRTRTVEAIVQLLVATAGRRPLAVAIEDVHWIDGGSEAVVAALAEALRDRPLLLIVTGRPEELHPWADQPSRPGPRPSASIAATLRVILRHPHAASIDLGRLSPAESRQLVEQVAARALPAQVVRATAARADGNPLFAVALTRALVAGPPSAEDRGPLQWSADDRRAAAVDLPATIRDVLLVRTDRLPTTLKQVLQLAAVIGPEIDYPLLAESAEPGLELELALARLEDLGFLHVHGLVPERRYAFDHGLMQTVIYEALLPDTTRLQHERVGRAIEALHADRLEEHAELLAHHYARSGDDEKAVEYLTQANRKATAVSAVAEAHAFFEAAFDRLARLPDTEANRARRVGLLLEQFPVMLLLGRLPAYHALLRSAEPLVSGLVRPELLAAYSSLVGACEWAAGQLQAARATLLRATVLAAAVDDETLAVAEILLERCELDLGQYDAAIGAYERARPIADRRLNLHWYLWARTGAMWAYAYRGRWKAARAVAAEVLRVGEEVDDRGMLANVTFNLALISVDQGDLARASAEAGRAVELATAPADRLMAQATAAYVGCHLGQAADGIPVLEQIVAALNAGGLVPAAIVSGVNLGIAYRLAEQTERARETLTTYGRRAEQAGLRFQQARAERLLGEMALDTGDDTASVHLERSIATLEALDTEHELRLARSAYGRLLAASTATATPSSAAPADVPRRRACRDHPRPR